MIIEIATFLNQPKNIASVNALNISYPTLLSVSTLTQNHIIVPIGEDLTAKVNYIFWICNNAVIKKPVNTNIPNTPTQLSRIPHCSVEDAA